MLTRRVRNRWIACSKAEDREILRTDILVGVGRPRTGNRNDCKA